MRAGDIITNVGRQPVDSREAFSTYTSTIAPNQQFDLITVRTGSTRTVQIRPSDPPANLGLRILEEVAGLRVADERRTVVIDQVLSGTRAATIGLEPGDVIVAVNATEITSTKDLNTEVSRGADRSSIVLSVARGRYVYNLTFPMGVQECGSASYRYCEYVRSDICWQSMSSKAVLAAWRGEDSAILAHRQS